MSTHLLERHDLKLLAPPAPNDIGTNLDSAAQHGVLSDHAVESMKFDLEHADPAHKATLEKMALEAIKHAENMPDLRLH